MYEQNCFSSKTSQYNHEKPQQKEIRQQGSFGRKIILVNKQEVRIKRIKE